MKFKEKILMDIEGLKKNGPINIVILGDSVSHGTVLDNNDYENVYHNVLRKKMNAYRDYVPVNMINASVGGTMAKDALPRIDKQVLSHDPDLVIVCFGLNDINGPLEDYLAALKEIFSKCKAAGVDTIFMSPNMLNTRVVEDAPQKWMWYAYETAKMQNEGKMDTYIYSAMDLAREMGVTVCDCYSKWKEMEKNGADITMMLVNRINHPTSEWHKLFADELYKIIIGEEECYVANDSGMYQGEVNQ